MVVILVQILLIQHHIEDIILIMVHYINFSFNWNLSSINNYLDFVFNVYGGTLAQLILIHLMVQQI